MSKPASRLSAFRSYSYYHVLAMCDSSNTADLLAKSTDLGTWDHATPDTQAPNTQDKTCEFGKYSPKCISSGNNACAGRYIILINGSTDAAYAITQARWTSATASNAVPGDSNTSLAVEGSISISEPKGVAFLDQVVQSSVALGVDSSQVVYCLKTFFVGFVFDPNTGDRPEAINDIPPLNFITYDVTGSFTEQGGTYEMMFVAVANGAARLPQYSKAVNGMSLTAGDNLSDTFKRLQDNITQSYDRYYSCVVSQLGDIGTDDARMLLESLCRVDYVINVSDTYNNSKYKVTDQPAQQKNTSGCNDKAQFTFPANTSIETAIATIMQMSPQVRDEMASGDPTDGVKYEFKIHSCVKSEPISGSSTDVGKLKYTVVYNVERFRSPRALAVDPGFAILAQDQSTLDSSPAYEKIKQNIIEFDYLYTGKNIDILDFDIKVNMGMAYLQTATLANTFKNQTERAANVVTGSAALDVIKKNATGVPLQTPVFFGKQIVTPKFLNTNNSAATIQSAYTMAKHAALEVAEASVRIVGNDRLLATTNRTTSAEQMLKGAPTTEETSGAPEQADFKHWNYIPAYAKINIKMPRNNDDLALFTGQTSGDKYAATGSADYAREFWFDGYYYVYGMDHVFDNGEFTQTLQMVSIPKTSTFDSTKTPTKDVDLDKQVGSCFDNTIGCGKANIPEIDTTSSAPTIPFQPATTSVDITASTLKKMDADTLIAMQSNDLNNIRGWSKASPEVKTAILNAADAYGIDRFTLALICAQESSFNPNATNGHAVGLFQFIPDSWDHTTLIVDSHITSQVLSNKNNRYDPQLSAYAGANYMKKHSKMLGGNTNPGDLYLAHFGGSGGGPRTIKADRATNGTALISDTSVLGPNTAKLYANANPGYIQENMTVRDFRAWASSVLANRLKNPTTVARNTANTPVVGSDTSAVKAPTSVAAKDKIALQIDCKTQDSKPNQETCNKKPAVEPLQGRTATGGTRVDQSGGA